MPSILEQEIFQQPEVVGNLANAKCSQKGLLAEYLPQKSAMQSIAERFSK